MADALVVTPTQVLVNGLAPGEISLLIWDELERSRSFDLRVDVDITAAREEFQKLFPNEQIELTPSRNAIVLSGHVTTEDVSKHAGALASAYAKNVVNVLTFGPVGADEVLLEVKFAEVDRTALTQSRHQCVFNRFGKYFRHPNHLSVRWGHWLRTHRLGPPHRFCPTSLTVSNSLTCFSLIRRKTSAESLRLCNRKACCRFWPSPTWSPSTARKRVSWRAEEFPFPVVQPNATGLSTVTIQFREFGVRLKFTPVIQPNGNIHMHVIPEVSTLDYSNAVTVPGTTIPALSTRKADTEFELQDGQSFVIAGLIDNRVTDIVNKIPGLGDIPILGNFFKSKSLQKSNSELMVLCTARRISPSAQAPKGPTMPIPVLDPAKFDGKRPSGAK